MSRRIRTPFGIPRLLGSLPEYIQKTTGITLRAYQVEAAQAVVRSALLGEGLSFVVMFPRQSGKNLLQAQIEAYLLFALSQQGGAIVKVSPTWRPQSLNAMRRLENVLAASRLSSEAFSREDGYIFRVGQASIAFLSGAPESNIVGATASTLLEVDEAQDVLIAKFDKDIAPMAASTNATRVFWGTAWTSQTLLARELRACTEAERRDGVRRVFRIDAETVGSEVPAYAAFVADQVAKLGRNHPLVRTQFFSEEIEGDHGMFPPERRALMQGGHPFQETPAENGVYVLLLDVAGEDEAVGSQAALAALPLDRAAARRDSTALTIVEMRFGTREGIDPASGLARLPEYRVVQRREWVGVRHTRLFDEIRALAALWRARRVIVDSTGVGAGLAAFLDQALPGRVIRFEFSAASKSRLGWDFLAICDTGRFKEGGFGSENQARLSTRFWRQVELCQYQVEPGAGMRLRWGVPEDSRDPHTGEPAHDDLLLSAALCAVMDGTPLAGGSGAGALLVPARDPLDEMTAY